MARTGGEPSSPSASLASSSSGEIVSSDEGGKSTASAMRREMSVRRAVAPIFLAAVTRRRSLTELLCACWRRWAPRSPAEAVAREEWGPRAAGATGGVDMACGGVLRGWTHVVTVTVCVEYYGEVTRYFGLGK